MITGTCRRCRCKTPLCSGPAAMSPQRYPVHEVEDHRGGMEHQLGRPNPHSAAVRLRLGGDELMARTMAATGVTCWRRPFPDDGSTRTQQAGCVTARCFASSIRPIPRSTTTSSNSALAQWQGEGSIGNVTSAMRRSAKRNDALSSWPRHESVHGEARGAVQRDHRRDSDRGISRPGVGISVLDLCYREAEVTRNGLLRGYVFTNLMPPTKFSFLSTTTFSISGSFSYPPAAGAFRPVRSRSARPGPR